MTSIMPPTPPVNPRTQCIAPGCGTMLLSDGTCPRCNPPVLRSPEEQLDLAEKYGDRRLEARAYALLDAREGGTAATLASHEEKLPCALCGKPATVTETMANADRLNAEIARRIDAAVSTALREERAKNPPPPPPPAG